MEDEQIKDKTVKELVEILKELALEVSQLKTEIYKLRLSNLD